MDQPVLSYDTNYLCSSLAQREPWSYIAMQLVRSASQRWTEANLETHDVEIRVSGLYSQNDHIVRLLLLSPDDMGRSETIRRLEQLSHLARGDSVAIIVLVDEDGTHGPTQSFMKLQTELSGSYLPSSAIMVGNVTNIPVVPLTAAENLSITLESFMSSLIGSKTSPTWPAEVIRDLLPRCAVNRQLSTQATRVIGGSFMSFRELLVEVAAEGGKDRVISLIGQDEGTRLTEFWRHEYALEQRRTG
ncbi:hypothetical protein OQA88_3813 [Cercophora sp. LCS_1]